MNYMNEFWEGWVYQICYSCKKKSKSIEAEYEEGVLRKVFECVTRYFFLLVINDSIRMNE